jgi:TolB protein
MTFRSVWFCIFCTLFASTLSAQEPTGIRLRVTYEPGYQPGFVVLPFSGGGSTSAPIRQIVRQDLDFSDRFSLKDAGSAGPGDAAEAARWRERGADWVLAGEVSPRAGGYTLRLTLHDAVYGQVKQSGSFALPAPGGGDFRMAVHAAADEVVRWATGEAGMAATRVAFVRQAGRDKEIFVVDSDGENVRRITNDGSIALSPAWSPGGGRIAYTSFRGDGPALYERDLATGRDRTLASGPGIHITPEYSPDGRTLAFAATLAGNTEVMTMPASGGSPRPQTRGRRFDSLSPTFAPDGNRIAFVSNRLGAPYVYVMQLGGEPRLVSNYTYGERGYDTSPDWSPTGAQIVYETRVRGTPQLVVVDASGSGARLLTNSSSNEDPSWAPDGRHVVFGSPNRGGGGLFVIDAASGRVRALLRGRGYGLPAWSGSLAR